MSLIEGYCLCTCQSLQIEIYFEGEPGQTVISSCTNCGRRYQWKLQAERLPCGYCSNELEFVKGLYAKLQCKKCCRYLKVIYCGQSHLFVDHGACWDQQRPVEARCPKCKALNEETLDTMYSLMICKRCHRLFDWTKIPDAQVGASFAEERALDERLEEYRRQEEEREEEREEKRQRLQIERDKERRRESNSNNDSYSGPNYTSNSPSPKWGDDYLQYPGM